MLILIATVAATFVRRAVYPFAFEAESGGTVLLGTVADRFALGHPAWAAVAAAIVVLATGIVIGRTAIRYSFYSVHTTIPMSMYGFFACGIAISDCALTAYCASLAMAVALNRIFSSYKADSIDGVFRGMMLMGLLPYIYAPATPCISIAIAAVFCFKLNIRQITGAFVGLLLPTAALSYISWLAGAPFSAPAVQVASALCDPARGMTFDGFPFAAAAIAALGIVTIIYSIFVFASNVYASASRTRPAIILSCFCLIAALGCAAVPSAGAALIPIISVPASLLAPIALTRTHDSTASAIFIIFSVLVLTHLFLQ